MKTIVLRAAVAILAGAWIAATAVTQVRLAPTAAQAAAGAQGVFTATATAGSPADLATADAALWSAGFLDNVGTPPAIARCQIATELRFDTGNPGLLGSAITSLRLHALLYRTGQQGSVTLAPPTTADSSEELAIHAARVQLFDATTQAWSDVGADLFAASPYPLGSPWRDTAYADRWSVPTSAAGAHPGPIDRVRTTGFVDGHASQGVVTLRLWFDLDIDGGGWDIAHVLDECWLDLDAGTGVQRYFPVAQQAWTDSVGDLVFLNTGERGNVASLLQAGDNGYAVTFFEDATPLVPTPVPPVHQEIWTEFAYDLTTAGVSIAELGSLRFQALLYKHGAQLGSPQGVPVPLGVPALPPAFDDSSEEARIHDAQIQVYDNATGQWVNLGPWLDAAEYSFGQPWRDTPYARRWSRPAASAGAHPGAILMDQGANWLQSYADAAGVVRVRVWEDFQFDTFGNWDIVHAFDFAWLEVQPRGVRAYGHACAPRPTLRPMLQVHGVPDATNGNPAFALGLADAPPLYFALAALSGARRATPLTDPAYPGCEYFLDELATVGLLTTGVGGDGRASIALPVPADNALVGAQVEVQWVVVGPQLELALSDAVRVVAQ